MIVRIASAPSNPKRQSSACKAKFRLSYVRSMCRARDGQFNWYSGRTEGHCASFCYSANWGRDVSAFGNNNPPGVNSNTKYHSRSGYK